MILVNILALVTLAATVVALMLSVQEAGLDRAVRFREAAQAAAIARAGELSAAVALRRDRVEAPDVDHMREPWARVVQADAAIEGGRFSLSVTDAQARFNLRNLESGGLGAIGGAALLERAAANRPDLVAMLAEGLRRSRAGGDLGQLRASGLDAATLARLAPLVTRLPGPAEINLNTAGPELIGLLFEPAAAQMLLNRRARAGFLTTADLDALNVQLPPGVGFTSNYWWVRTAVTIGGTRQTLTSLLFRSGAGEEAKAVTLGRWWGAAAPDQPPG